MSAALDRRLAAAVALAGEAGALALSMRPPPGAPVATLKAAQDWLTEADGAVEDLVSRRLAEQFPDDGFFGEERGRARDGALHWVLDPIDGTANYARGGNRFCISLGLIGDGTPLLGVIVAPALHETFAARRGGGATLNGAPIRVAGTTDLARGTVECGWSPRRPNETYVALVASIMATGATMRAGGSGALGLADVAAGRLDAYLELHINLWDVAAGLAILAEAGAAPTGFLEQDGARAGAPIVAAVPAVAEPLRNVLASLTDRSQSLP